MGWPQQGVDDSGPAERTSELAQRSNGCQAAHALGLLTQSKAHNAMSPASSRRSGRAHEEKHRSSRTGWLRAAVLGSNDAIVSTASLMLGVSSANASKESTLIAGVAGLVAGAMSMAVGEYVSVSSQRDAEQADIELEKRELARNPQAELQELAQIYQKRGLSPELALKVAEQLSAHDRLGAHMHDELGLDPQALARPLQASLASAASFAFFATIPVIALMVAPTDLRRITIGATSLLSMAVLGLVGAQLGGAPKWPAALRVTLGGATAMAATAAIGHLLGVSVS